MGFNFKASEGLSDTTSFHSNSSIDRLYLLLIEMPSGMKVVKIGKASGSSSLDRMMQINRDIFNKYRCTAKIQIKRDRPIDKDVFKYEAELHKFFKDYKYNPKVAFDGSSECFVIYEEAAVSVYEHIIEHGLGSLDDFYYEPLDYVKPQDNLSF